jgi:hypothetical protein
LGTLSGGGPLGGEALGSNGFEEQFFLFAWFPPDRADLPSPGRFASFLFFPREQWRIPVRARRGTGAAMDGDDKRISAQAIYAAQILSVIQLTKRHLAELLKIDIAYVDRILAEIRSNGLPLMSSYSEDDRLYFWMEKTEEN